MKTFISMKAKSVIYTCLLSALTITTQSAKANITAAGNDYTRSNNLVVSSNRVTFDDPVTLNSTRGTNREASSPLPTIFPVFKPVDPICANATLSPLPTTSLNGITGSWSPALNNQATTTYTFTPDPGQDAFDATLTIEVDGCCYQPDFCFNVVNKKVSFTSVLPGAPPSPCVYRYKWYWGDGTSSATYNTAAAADNATKTYANMGTYDVCLEVKRICPGSPDTCCKMICKTINLIERCDAVRINAELGVSLRSSAAGTVVAPVISGSSFRALFGTEISIDFGTPALANYAGTTGTNTFTIADATRTYTTPGTYDYCVTLKYVNAQGDSCVDKRCKSILIEPHCATQAYFSVASCATEFGFTFTPIGNSPTSVVNWELSNFATASSIGNDPVFHLAGNNIFQACMRVQEGKCYSSACYTVFANGSNTTVCGTPSAMFTDESGSVINPDNFDLKEVMLPIQQGKENLSSFVYPNPAGNEVNLILNAPKTSIAKIVVRASDGRVISTQTTTVDNSNSKEILDISRLENGMYAITIEVDGQVNTHKISVVK